MRVTRLENADALATSTALAVVFALLSYNTSSRHSVVSSDIICWVLVPLLITKFTKGDLEDEIDLGVFAESKTRNNEASSLLVWAVALCIATTSWYTIEYGIIPIYPTLVPLLLRFVSDVEIYQETQRPTSDRVRTSLWNIRTCSIAVALLQTMVLSDWTSRGCFRSIPILATLLFVFTVFLNCKAQFGAALPTLNFEKNIVTLSTKILFLTTVIAVMQTIVLHYPFYFTATTLICGVMKALWWKTIAQVARQTSWIMAPAVMIFCVIASHDLLTQTSQLYHIFRLVAGFLALRQISYFLPSNTKYNPWLWTLLCLPIFSSAASFFLTSQAQHLMIGRNGVSRTLHIENLIKDAQADFQSRLEKQSRSYAAACVEYKKRYSMEPPPGFEGWYNFAVRHRSPIIDDYDMIFQEISPFLKLSGNEVLKMVNQARNTSNIDLWHCTFSSVEGKTECTHPTRTNDRNIGTAFDGTLGPLRGLLPDLQFLVNHLDEPRVLIPKANHERRPDELNMVDLSGNSTWKEITSSCINRKSNASASGLRDTPRSKPLLISDISASKDLCHHAEYANMHAMFTSPASFKLLREPVPILSTGSLSTLNDILFPSPAYSEVEFEYSGKHDIPWEQKTNSLYWSGSTTGGYANKDITWRTFHRQRFVSFIESLTQGIFSHSTNTSKKEIIARLVALLLNRNIYDVGFSKIFQCSSTACEQQKATFLLSPKSSSSLPFHSRLAFDLDGNGISGRFYRLLASHSLPLKQTLINEWHDERLMPWVHYIPISLGMGELQDVVWYLTIDRGGREKAREIAEEGRIWFGKAMRDVDRSVYMYRLMLELARMMDEGREGWT